MHYLDMHTVAIYATRLTFKHFRENVFNQVFNRHRVSNLKYKGKVELNHIITIDGRWHKSHTRIYRDVGIVI